MDFSKPRVAIYYDVLPQTGMRNDGAPCFTHYNLRKIINGQNLTQLNSGGMMDGSGNVEHLSPINPTKHTGTFDLNVLVDYGEDVLGIPIDWEIPHPNAYWAFDVHIDAGGYKYRLNRARQFDHVFLCHKAYIKDFIKHGIDPAKIHYLPVAAETDCYRPYPIMEKWDWGFVGHFNSQHRIDLLDRFIKEFGLGGDKGYIGYRIPSIQGHCVLDDAAKKYSMSRIVINDSINRDLNMRTFEAMACKKLVLTQWNEPCEELFENNKHIVYYEGIDEAVIRARFYLKETEERNAIALAGYNELISKHTYYHRTLEILKTSINWAPKGDLVLC